MDFSDLSGMSFEDTTSVIWDGPSSRVKGFCYSSTSTTPTISDSVIYETGELTVGDYSITLTGLTPNTTYYVRAFVILDSGEIIYGDAVSFLSGLAAPENVAVTADSDHNTVVFDVVDQAEWYNIYWGLSSGVTKETGTKISGIVNNYYLHWDVTPGTTYYYVVTAETTLQESEISSEVSAVARNKQNIVPIEFRPANYLSTEDYVRLLTSQYQLASNFKSWLRAPLGILNDIMTLANSMPGEFDIDFASGAQLDIIGQIVGQSRVLPFQPTSISNATLDDETYRSLLRAKVALNHWDGKIASIEEKWATIFPDTQIVITDNQDMSINISILGEFEELLRDLIENDMIIPRPQGVQINFSWTPASTVQFAYDMENAEYGGYDIGKWSMTE